MSEIFRVETVGGAQFLGQVDAHDGDDIILTEALQLLQGVSPQGVQLMCLPFGDFSRPCVVTPAAFILASKDEVRVYQQAKAGMSGLVLP